MGKTNLQYLLHKYHIQPQESKGQHFLFDDAMLQTIVQTARRGSPEDTVVLEIGPGIGNLTTALAEVYQHVIAIELDRQFEKLLYSLCQVNTHVSVLYDDILKVTFATLRKAGITPETRYAVVANVPYYLTSKLIAHVLQYPQLPSQILFLVQREVALRIVANNGKYSKLALSVWFYGTPEIIQMVPRASFYPPPEVDSALLRIRQVHAWEHPESEKLVWRLIAFGFASKRKKLINNLCAGLRLPRSDVESLMNEIKLDLNIRAEDVLMPQWLGLARVVQRLESKNNTWRLLPKHAII